MYSPTFNDQYIINCFIYSPFPHQWILKQIPDIPSMHTLQYVPFSEKKHPKYTYINMYHHSLKNELIQFSLPFVDCNLNFYICLKSIKRPGSPQKWLKSKQNSSCKHSRLERDQEAPIMVILNHWPFCKTPEVQDKGKSPADQSKLALASEKSDNYQLPWWM